MKRPIVLEKTVEMGGGSVCLDIEDIKKVVQMEGCSVVYDKKGTSYTVLDKFETIIGRMAPVVRSKK